MTFELQSSVFDHEGPIPAKFTCDADDISPPLAWSGAPEGTRSFALIVDDPDAPDPHAPKMVWVHWVLYKLPADCTGLPEDARDEQLPGRARHGTNDWKRAEYGGPCPPIGRHRYFFKLYALDDELPEMGQPTKTELEQQLEGHVLAEAVLMGTYIRDR